MTSVSAHDVAAEVRRLLPGVEKKKLHKLLYYCQGHHLADVGAPLFLEDLKAYDMGPVVANLWKAEQEGWDTPDPRPLDSGQLNTVMMVVSRYGQLSGGELERLTHAETPWRSADTGRMPGQSARIEQVALREYFVAEAQSERAEMWPNAPDLNALTEGAEHRRLMPGRPDDLESLRARSATG